MLCYAVIYFLICDGFKGVKDSIKNTAAACRGQKVYKEGMQRLVDEDDSTENSREKFEDSIDDEIAAIKKKNKKKINETDDMDDSKNL